MTVDLDREQEFVSSVRNIANGIARVHADEVDRDARFPVEAVTALREAHVLSALVPQELGGAGVSMSALARAARDLGRACSATAMVFAMHQIQVATIVRHLEPDSWFEDYLRELCIEPRLIASITSEVGTGGDIGRSIAPVRDAGDGVLCLHKQAPTVSYGAQADDFLTTARRSEEARESDQVLVLSRRDDTDLEQTGTWDTIGMRGTCSPSFTVDTRFSAQQILSAPFAGVLNESHVPISHILWSHVWLGIATEAFERARSFLRAAARRTPDRPVAAAHGLSRVMSELSMMRAEVNSALAEFEHVGQQPDREALTTMGSVLRFNNLKLATSEQAPRICAAALEVIGIAAYKNDSPYGVGRQLRDSLSARLMVANERIHAMDAGLLLIAKEV
jgi:acyl-CoA dehydrogenase